MSILCCWCPCYCICWLFTISGISDVASLVGLPSAVNIHDIPIVSAAVAKLANVLLVT